MLVCLFLSPGPSFLVRSAIRKSSITSAAMEWNRMNIRPQHTAYLFPNEGMPRWQTLIIASARHASRTEKDLKWSDSGKSWKGMSLSACPCAYQTRVAGCKLPQVKPKNGYIHELLVEDTLKIRGSIYHYGINASNRNYRYRSTDPIQNTYWEN